MQHASNVTASDSPKARLYKSLPKDLGVDKGTRRIGGTYRPSEDRVHAGSEGPTDPNLWHTGQAAYTIQARPFTIQAGPPGLYSRMPKNLGEDKG